MKVLTVESLSEQLPHFLVELNQLKVPVKIVSPNGYSAYMLGVDEYDAMISKIEILEGLLKGEADLESGSTQTNADAKKFLNI